MPVLSDELASKRLLTSLLTVGVLTVLVALFWSAWPLKDTAEIPPRSNSESPETAALGDAAAGMHPDQADVASGARAVSAMGSYAAVGAKAPMLNGADLWNRKIPRESLSLSREESAWLRRNGYPTPEELENLESLDLDELRRRSKGGDAAAMVLLGMRVGVENGVNLIEQAQIHGSRFAMLEAHRRATRLDLAHTKPYSLALALMAQMLGDHRAAMATSDSYYHDSQFRDIDVRWAMEGAQRLLGNLNARRAALGLPPLQHDTRPGFSDWDAAERADQYPLVAGRGG